MMKTNNETKNQKKGDAKRPEAKGILLTVIVVAFTVLLTVLYLHVLFSDLTTFEMELVGLELGTLIAMGISFRKMRKSIKDLHTNISELRTETEGHHKMQYEKIKAEIEKEMTKQLIVGRAQISNHAEDEYQKENELRLRIFSRLSMREMTGEDVYKIMQELLSQRLSELEDTLNDLMSGEEEVRSKLFERISKERDLSEEQKEKTAEFLKPLNLSELEEAEASIFTEKEEEGK